MAPVNLEREPLKFERNDSQDIVINRQHDARNP